MRDYQLISPSLDGILLHSSVVYEGISRPMEVLKLMDGPATRGRKKESVVENIEYTERDQKVIQQYFHDLNGVFMKKLSSFVIDAEPRSDDLVTLPALLQEMIKIRQLLAKNTPKLSD